MGINWNRLNEAILLRSHNIQFGGGGGGGGGEGGGGGNASLIWNRRCEGWCFSLVGVKGPALT